MTTLIDADLSFELLREGRDPVHGRLTGRANRLVLEVDDPGAFAGGADADAVRSLARGLAERGVVVRVVHADQHLVTLGAVSAPWWQRRLTRSRRIRLGSLRGAWTSARSRLRAGEGVLPSASMLPPTTLWPPAPTFARRGRRRVTTTHDPGRGGAARLVLLKQAVWQGEQQLVFWLEDDTVVGSGESCSIRLPGLAERHALLTHDEDDEWVIEAVGGPTRVHGQHVDRQVLRTGARVEVGAHVLGYFREEHADHGRPHGGRIGGELGRQLPQQPRGG